MKSAKKDILRPFAPEKERFQQDKAFIVTFFHLRGKRKLKSLFAKRMKSIIYTSLLMLAFVGCSRYPAESEIPAELEVEAEVLMEQKELGPLAVDQLPEGLNQLSPKSVQLKEEGLYIKLWSSFVEEGGLFIPRNKTKVYNRSTDPGYWKANNETCYYIFKG